MPVLSEWVTAAEAREMILAGEAPADLRVQGRLDLSNQTRLTQLPSGLRVSTLDLSGCNHLTELPEGLSCYHLDLRGSGIRSLPPDLRVEFKIDLQDCKQLTHLPAG